METCICNTFMSGEIKEFFFFLNRDVYNKKDGQTWFDYRLWIMIYHQFELVNQIICFYTSSRC